MVGGMSSFLGVIVVFLMLTVALLFFLNRKAVSVRHEFEHESRSFFAPEFASGDGEAGSFWSQQSGTTPSLDLVMGVSAGAPPTPFEEREPVIPAVAPPSPLTTTVSLDPVMAVASSDPVAIVVEGLLEGTGELTPDDLRRLELYRPERVIQYAEQVQAHLQGRGSQAGRARLDRVRRYAESLITQEVDIETPQSATLSGDSDGPAAASPADERALELPDTPTPTTLAWDAPPVVVLEPDLTLPDEPADEPELAQIVSFPGHYQPTDVEPESMDAFQLLETGPPVVDIAWPDQAALSEEEGVASFPMEMVDESGADHPLYMVEEDAPWGEEPAMPVEIGEPWHAPDPVEETTGDALAGTDEPPPSEGDSAESPPVAPAPTLEEKREVIDRLAEAGSTDALNGLQLYLDDEDPTIQLYALEAAEGVLSRG